ncbi:VOC family protein [Leptolyngbya sp. AN02str]|uniref:VOC family protein n=1 Tax=Leptolyngbya sp. AN02str TaxID=3423363 RepID=UPI003D311C71
MNRTPNINPDSNLDSNSNLHCKTVFVALACGQLERMAQFYGQVFGLEPAVQLPGVYAEFRLPGLRLGLFKPGAHNPEFAGLGDRPAGAMSLCVEVRNLEAAMAAIAAAYQQLQPNATVPTPMGNLVEASHGREVYAYDPEGNRIILHEGKEP